jgi:hypothetical protein
MIHPARALIEAHLSSMPFKSRWRRTEDAARAEAGRIVGQHVSVTNQNSADVQVVVSSVSLTAIPLDPVLGSAN